MTVILRGTVPPIAEIAKLGYAEVAVYNLLYQSVYQDQRYDSRKCIRVSEKRDCGGTTNWSHKAIAETLQMGKSKVSHQSTYYWIMDLVSMKGSHNRRKEAGIESTELFIQK